MTTLSTLQSYFQDYLLNNSNDMLALVTPDTKFSADKRLKVYFDAYRIRLHEILKLDFEKTHTLMGDEQFDKAFHLYLKMHPSRHFSVRYFGQFFPEFLNETAPFENVPVFSEMAFFEWSISHTLDAHDATPVQQDKLITLSPDEWPDLCFQFHPSVISHCFEWNTPALWMAIDKEEPPSQPKNEHSLTRWIFWRKGIKSYFQSCCDYESILFESIEDKLTFSEMCEALLDCLPEEEIPLKTAQTLNKWVQEEMLVLPTR